MNKTELTIIMPAYNVEKYIQRCIDSILEQTYTEYEIIIVDDASKDTTRQIILENAKKNERIKTILLDENKGPGDARQYALDQAQGEYIMFIDSDDRYISNNALDKMISSMKKSGADCVCCRYVVYYSSHLSVKKGPEKNDVFMSNKEVAIEKLKKPKFYWHYLIIRCYKREIIEKNNIRFKSGLLVTEDMKFNNDYMFYAKNYYFINDYLYEYNCANEHSITKSRYRVSFDFYHDLFLKSKAQYKYHSKLYKDMGLYSICRKEIASIMYINTTRLLIDVKKGKELDKLNVLIQTDEDYKECEAILGGYSNYIKMKVFSERYLNKLKYYVKLLVKKVMP